MELCYKNLVKRERASLQNTTESVCLLLSAIFTRECNRTLACMVSNFFTITHFAYKCKLLQGYLVDEILTLPHPPFSPYFANMRHFVVPTSQKMPCNFFLVPTTQKNVFLGKDSTEGHPSDKQFPVSFTYNIFPRSS